MNVGDRVVVNQPLVEIETAKAVVELPSPYAGEVVELLAAAGDVVDVGNAIITIETEPDTAAAGKSAPVDERSPDASVAAGLIGGEAPGGRTAVLVVLGCLATLRVFRAQVGQEGN